MKKELWEKLMSEVDSKIDLDEWQKSSKSYINMLGKTTMLFKAVEECSEMQQAISKCYRNELAIENASYKDGDSAYNAFVDSVENLTEEMGDVILQIFNICQVFDIDVFDVIRAANVKVEYGKMMEENKMVK